MNSDITSQDMAAIRSFQNFLSWGEQPGVLAPRGPRNVPPCWWAYVMGLTNWCPSKGEW